MLKTSHRSVRSLITGLSLSLALVLAAPAALAAPPPPMAPSPASAMTPEEELAAAEQASQAYRVSAGKAADDNFAAYNAQADTLVSNARRAVDLAAQTYREDASLANFSVLAQAQATLALARKAGVGIKRAAKYQLRVEKRPIGKVADLMLWAPRIRLAFAVNLVPPVCGDPYYQALVVATSGAIDELKALPVRTLADYEARIREYADVMTVLYGNEVTARVAYEEALRAYARDPNPATKGALSLRREELRGAIFATKWDGRVHWQGLTRDLKRVSVVPMQIISGIEDAVDAEMKPAREALLACGLDNLPEE